MTEQTESKRESRQYSLSLFPEHDQIVRLFAEESKRSFSNALQFIIEDWARMKRTALEAAAPNQEAV